MKTEFMSTPIIAYSVQEATEIIQRTYTPDRFVVEFDHKADYRGQPGFALFCYYFRVSGKETG